MIGNSFPHTQNNFDGGPLSPHVQESILVHIRQPEQMLQLSKASLFAHVLVLHQADPWLPCSTPDPMPDAFLLLTHLGHSLEVLRK